MRKIWFLLPVTALFLGACNNNNPKETTILDKDGKGQLTIKPSEVAAAAEKLTEKIDELKKLTPLTIDELKAKVPEEFLGMKRTSFSANAMMGTASCNATYKSEDGKQFRVSIFDGAGEAGAGLVGLRFYDLWNFEQEDENGYRKTVDFNGGKAIESYSKRNEEYGLTYVANGRFLVDIQGQKSGLEGVQAAARSLDLK